MNQRKRLQREWSFVYMIDISTPTNLPVIPLARVTHILFSATTNKRKKAVWLARLIYMHAYMYIILQDLENILLTASANYYYYLFK